jgi:hypothetical protein
MPRIKSKIMIMNGQFGARRERAWICAGGGRMIRWNIRAQRSFALPFMPGITPFYGILRFLEKLAEGYLINAKTQRRKGAKQLITGIRDRSGWGRSAGQDADRTHRAPGREGQGRGAGKFQNFPRMGAPGDAGFSGYLRVFADNCA